MEMVDLLIGFAIGFVGAAGAFLLFGLILFVAWLASLRMEWDDRPRRRRKP